MRINIGCGQTPTSGWRNYDNSWSVRLAAWPLARMVLTGLGRLSVPQREFIAFAQQNEILWASATRRIPEADGSADVLYSSHMIEHIEKRDVLVFLQEARRVLRSGGIIRIAVPNIRYHVDQYLSDEDADRFIANTRLTREMPRSIPARIRYLLVGDRNHQWMYDGKSLCHLLASAGFQAPTVMEAGTTIIADPGALNLTERAPESVFVEAVNP